MAKEKRSGPRSKQDAGDRNTGQGGPGRGDVDYSGRTVGDTATSYSSVGGHRVGQPTSPLGESGPVHEEVFRPGPGGSVEGREEVGRRIPFTGDAVSTRDSTFEENPDTGLTADEEAERLLTQSLEKRTRGHESG